MNEELQLAASYLAQLGSRAEPHVCVLWSFRLEIRMSACCCWTTWLTDATRRGMVWRGECHTLSVEPPRAGAIKPRSQHTAYVLYTAQIVKTAIQYNKQQIILCYVYTMFFFSRFGINILLVHQNVFCAVAQLWNL